MRAMKLEKGRIFRCPVCGAEIVILTRANPSFRPVCCNRPMQLRPVILAFYRCKVCGAEILCLAPAPADFRPRCCNTEMVRMVV